MAIEGFDYKTFAQNLAQQAQELIPPDFNDMERNYVANTLLNFSSVAGEALYNDTESNFDVDQAVMITQIIAEWSYHKSVDLVKSGLPQQFWDPIMQKIAFTIFEIAKQAFKQSLPQDQVLQLIEHHVKKTYLDCISELKDKNMIDVSLMEKAAGQSNIDQMMQQQVQEEQSMQSAQMDAEAHGLPVPQAPDNTRGGVIAPLGSDQKILKLATLALLFQKIKQDKVQTILNKFNPDDAQSVIRFMGMPDLENKVDPYIALRCLQEIKTYLPNARSLSPSKIVSKIQSISQYFDRSQLEMALKLERPKVKRLIFNALEGEYYEIAPKVANVIASHLENSV